MQRLRQSTPRKVPHSHGAIATTGKDHIAIPCKGDAIYGTAMPAQGGFCAGNQVQNTDRVITVAGCYPPVVRTKSDSNRKCVCTPNLKLPHHIARRQIPNSNRSLVNDRSEHSPALIECRSS